MSTFQFPSNPDDGDLIVRGSLLATYDKVNNTWVVSEIDQTAGVPGPPGPQGPEGPPGEGVSVVGIVDTFDDLPNYTTVANQFWLVDDTNTLHYSDGFSWRDLGSPVRGPAGADGVDGTDGAPGLNGSPGKGWYDTNIIDERPSNYQVEFLSNDGLGFVTDNIMGPQGASGTIPVASETVLGGIKIGRGLSMTPGGTANVNQANVDLETTPLQPGNFALPNKPIYVECSFETADGSFENFRQIDNKGPYSQADWIVGVPVTIAMPETANGAIVTWTAPSYFSTTWAAQNITYPHGATLNFRAYLNHYLYVYNAAIVGRPETGRSLKGIAHNYNPIYFEKADGTTSITNRYSTNSFNKVEYIEFQPGAEVTFQIKTDIGDMSTGTVSVGGVRINIEPFRIEEELDVRLLQSRAGFEDFEQLPISTPAEIELAQVTDLKSRTRDLIFDIDAVLADMTDPLEIENLNALKTEVLGVIDLPGTYEDLSDELSRLSRTVNIDYFSKQYRFETT